jgi:hypothetical protein
VVLSFERTMKRWWICPQVRQNVPFLIDNVDAFQLLWWKQYYQDKIYWFLWKHLTSCLSWWRQTKRSICHIKFSAAVHWC